MVDNDDGDDHHQDEGDEICAPSKLSIPICKRLIRVWKHWVKINKFLSKLKFQDLPLVHQLNHD